MIDGKKIDNDRLEDTLVLWLLYKESCNRLATEWEAFCKAIKGANRYFPESDIVDKILQLVDVAETTLVPGAVLYRARVVGDHATKIEEATNDVWRQFVESLSLSKQFDLSGATDEATALLAIPDDASKKELIDKWATAREGVGSFCGLPAKESDAPPRDRASSGRANPKGISCLYAATTKETALQEVRPRRGDRVSVAEVKVMRALKVFDFSKGDSASSDINGHLLDMLSTLFSEPLRFGDEDFLPTQYICECLKSKGYDGVCYKSALSESGLNFAFFDTSQEEKGYEIIGSELFVVNAIDISYSLLGSKKFC